jgi:hypothetical protein
MGVARVGIVAARILLGVLLVAASAGATSEVVYRFDWQSFARLSRWDGADVVTDTGSLTGTGSARLIPIGPGAFRLEFRGPDGEGAGMIGPAGATAFSFPTAVAVGMPPAPPHLSGGTFEVNGDPGQPDAFEVYFVEGFICHAARPQTCDNVAGWERSFVGRGRRAPPGSRLRAPFGP